MELETLVLGTRYDHSQKVAEISKILALGAGYSEREAALIGGAALYHDIGKCHIPRKILNKPGPLSPDEFNIIKKHTHLGHSQIVEAQQLLNAAAIICLQHHERMDGSGYMGLGGDEIHPYARLVGVADVLDALLSERAYKRAWRIDEVKSFFLESPGALFDAQIVTILMELLNSILLVYTDAEALP